MLTSNKDFNLNSNGQDLNGLLEDSYPLDGPYTKTYSQFGNNLIPADLADKDPETGKNPVNQTVNLPYGTKRLNSFSYPSDEYTTEHGKQHALFLGCSNTFGHRLPDKYLWSKKLQEDLFPESGFFNIGMPGGGIEEIIYNAFLYMKNYGKPEAIFCLMPNFGRGLNRNLSTSIIKAAQAYTAFEEYCKEAKISLISLTWDYVQKNEDRSVNNVMPQLFETFHQVDVDELARLTHENYLTDPNNRIILKWDNKGHFGIAPHHAYYQIFKKIYQEEN